ncbi:MAG TPA: chromosomal replication initiator protein DnaA [Ignavibacteria bacterium]|nr:chromosomal replication initiator protein DnaA [Ignavibacteria bacterium]
MNDSTLSAFQNSFGSDNFDVNKKHPSFSEASDIWGKFLELLESKIKKSVIETWFTFLKPVKFENETLTVSVPNQDIYGMIESRFNKEIDNVLKSIIGDGAVLKFEISQLDLFDSDETITSEPIKIKISDENGNFNKSFTPTLYNKITDNEEDKFSSNLYPKNTFETFVKGENNELAVSIAYAITNNPGKSYNPFFIYGGVGLGKTHLVQSIGNEIQLKFPDKRVFYTTASEFTNRFTDSIAQNRMDFSNKGAYGTKKLDKFYKSLDVLIIDDIQNLSGKTSTQDYFYQIFNYLFHEKKHIIFSSDKPVTSIIGIEERLLNRFQWGMIADIQPPSWEVRVAIIKKKLQIANIEAPEDVIHFLATNVKDSIRTIEGCIAGMIAESTFIHKGDIDINIAEKVVTRVVGMASRSKSITLENILDTVSDYYNIQKRDILSKKRVKEIVFARHIAMFLAKELTDMTLSLIGSFFNGKDHATVVYAVKTIDALQKNNKKITEQLNFLREKIKNN